MSYIPDTRNPIEKIFFGKKEEPNAYYEGLLDIEDKRYMDFYDFGVADCINALDNFDDLLDMAETILEDEIPEGKESYFTDEEYEFLCNERTIKFIKYLILSHAESERDEMVITAIESMDEDKYNDKFNEFERLYKEDRAKFDKLYKRREYNDYGTYDEDEE